MMFERFTGDARQVVVLAQDESRRLMHDYVGTEHLLLGLLRQGDGTGARALGNLGIDLAAMRSDIAEVIGTGPSKLARRDAEALETIGIDLDTIRRRAEDTFGPGALERPADPRGRRRRSLRRAARSRGRRPFTPRAKKALELGLRHAKALRHSYVGTEHILLGLTQAVGLGTEILARHDVSPSDVRRAVMAELGRGGNAPRRSA